MDDDKGGQVSYPKPRRNCPYCGSFNLKVKPWRSRGTWFVACECTATGPSMARTPEEAVELFDRRAPGMEVMSLKEFYDLTQPPKEA